MWGRVVLATSFVVLILVGGFLSLNHIMKVCTQISQQVLSQSDKNAQPDESVIKSAFNEWKKHESYFSAVIPHNRVDAVTVAFQSAIGYCETNTAEEYHASLLELIQLIDLVARFDRLSSRNIF